MKYYLIMRRWEAYHDLRAAWRSFARHLRIVSCRTLVLLEMLSLGETITMLLLVTLKNDLTGGSQWCMEGSISVGES